MTNPSLASPAPESAPLNGAAGAPVPHATDLVARAHAGAARVQQLFQQGRLDDALRQGNITRQDWQHLERPGDECELLVQLSMALAEADRHDEAIHLARAAHTLAQAHALDARMPRVLALLGGLHGALQAWLEGENLLLLALSLARDRHDAATVLAAVNGLLVHLVHAHGAQVAEGQQRQAWATTERLLRHARQALALVGDEPVAFRRAVLRSNAAAALQACGQVDEAVALLEVVAADADTQGFRVVGLRARLRLGNALLAAGDAAGAQQQAAVVSAMLAEQDHALARMELLRLQAGLAQAAGRPVEAQRCQDLHRALDTPRQALDAAVHQAMAGFNPGP